MARFRLKCDITVEAASAYKALLMAAFAIEAYHLDTQEFARIEDDGDPDGTVTVTEEP